MAETTEVTEITWAITFTFIIIGILLILIGTFSIITVYQKKHNKLVANVTTITESTLKKAKNEIKINLEKERMNLEKEKKMNLEKERRTSLKGYIITNYRGITEEIGKSIAESICTLSAEYKIDYNLIVGIISVESSFNPHAISKVEARGLMQVRYGVWKDHLEIKNIEELHDINKGIKYGILAFLQCRKEAKGNLEKALQKYSGTKDQSYTNKIYKEIGKFTLMKNK